jgi:predicted esterase
LGINNVFRSSPLTPFLRCISVASVLSVTVAANIQLSFEYDRKLPLDVHEASRKEKDGALLREISYATLDGKRNGATLVTPAAVEKGDRPRPAILFVHWYGPPEPTSNRSQFVPDAIELARAGAVSLLIDTPWSDPDYFPKRKREEDYDRSVAQVKDLRRALDVLLAQPAIDPSRVAYVGHDFGAMYGVLAASVDPRIRLFVFMAGTRSFSDWFLLGEPKLEGDARQKFIDRLAPLDPIAALRTLNGIPLLFQFATDDRYVPKATADALVAAAPGKPDVRTYKAEHELNEEATRDRIEWLTKRLNEPVRPVRVIEPRSWSSPALAVALAAASAAVSLRDSPSDTRTPRR